MGFVTDPLAGVAGGDLPDVDLLTAGVGAVNRRWRAG